MHDYERADEVTIEFAPGDALLMYTDGVTDVPGAAERFGDERLVAAVAAAPPDADALVAAVSAELDTFASGTALDDRAMRVLQRT